MENTNSVQDEQFGKKKAENTMSPENSNEQANPHEAVEDFESNAAEMLLPESVEIPDELKDEGEDDELAEPSQPSADYSGLSKDQLVEQLKRLIQGKSIEDVKNDVESIKICFYKKYKSEFDLKRNEFVAAGGKAEEFKLEDASEQRLKELIILYKEQRRSHNQTQEQEKQNNLKAKLQIIEEIKELTNSHEKLHDTYSRFRELQKQWRETGMVPQKNVTDLYENFNHNVEKFYDFLKLNKELRDLDLKKNLEQKITLCERAEELLLEPSVLKAFKILQDYHTQWREIGPVAPEKRNEVWERFKAATTKVNKAYQDFFEKQKDDQKKNLELKTQICEKAEETLQHENKTLQEWDEKSKAMIELQQLWRTIGFAPRKDNNRIYQRFHDACNEFFKNKKEFFGRIKEEQNKNYQLKLDICMQAESYRDSTDWKRATDELILLQRRWKQIGPVPKKYSEVVWRRFRAACDSFFNRKSEFFATIDQTYEDNFNKKMALVEEIKKYELKEEVEQSFVDLKEFQQRWSEIGFVPLQKKEEIQKAYREAIDAQFNKMKIDDGKRRMMKFKNKIEGLSSSPKGNNKMNFERDKYITRLRKLESEIKLWENNIGFFAKSKNAQAMINDVQQKIEAAKVEIKQLEDQINLIDNMTKD